MHTRGIVLATLLGTVLQVAMVVIGHTNPSVAALFAVGGMGFSLLAGAAYPFFARGTSTGAAAAGGAIVGALCAFIGIAISYAYGDVPASLLALGTLSSAVTGAIGGALGRLVAGRGAAITT